MLRGSFEYTGNSAVCKTLMRIKHVESNSGFKGKLQSNHNVNLICIFFVSIPNSVHCYTFIYMHCVACGCHVGASALNEHPLSSTSGACLGFSCDGEPRESLLLGIQLPGLLFFYMLSSLEQRDSYIWEQGKEGTKSLKARKAMLIWLGFVFPFSAAVMLLCLNKYCVGESFGSTKTMTQTLSLSPWPLLSALVWLNSILWTCFFRR